MTVADNGDLVVQSDGGEICLHKPVIYQPAPAEAGRRTVEKTLVAGRYTINEQKEVAFAIGDYDRTKPLVIDPVLAYSTYLGGSGDDRGNGIAVDSSGNAYVTDITASADFPLANPIQTTNKGSNAFVSKLSADGSALVYSTYLGGTYQTAQGFSCCGANAIAVDSFGNATVTGQTTASDFPTDNPIQGRIGALVCLSMGAASTLSYRSSMQAVLLWSIPPTWGAVAMMWVTASRWTAPAMLM